MEWENVNVGIFVGGSDGWLVDDYCFLFIQLFNKQLLQVGCVLGVGNQVMNRIGKVFVFMEEIDNI